jgi:hypothetical protein
VEEAILAVMVSGSVVETGEHLIGENDGVVDDGHGSSGSRSAGSAFGDLLVRDLRTGCTTTTLQPRWRNLGALECSPLAY